MARLSLFLLLALAPTASAQLTADAIMARVATNQDRSEEARAHFVYVQHAKIASHKGKTVMCEEVTDYRVTPNGKESSYNLLKLDGKLFRKSKYIVYNEKDVAKADAKPKPDEKAKPESDDINITIGDDDTDRDLVENMRKNLTQGKSKDGIYDGLFPLTTKAQADYEFKLLGREMRNGRDCFHIEFHPKDKEDIGWKGDAYIDSIAFQPVLLRTTMSRNIPLAVRLLLGTSVPGLGFTIIYAPQSKEDSGQDELWFPVSFGTEFKLHVLFFLNRQIVFNAENRDFEKTHVTSEIVDSPK